MIAKNRIFTRVLHYTPVVPTTDLQLHVAPDSFIAEEDVTLIAVSLQINPIVTFIGDDGIAWLLAELNQGGGVLGTPGAILHARAYQEWNTAPAFGHFGQEVQRIVFPTGYGVTVKEEGILQMLVQGVNDSATADLVFCLRCFLYYVKG